MAEIKRSVFKTANKYQQHIIYMVFFPTVFTFVAFFLIIFVGNPYMSYAILHASSSNMGHLLNQFSSLLILVICMFFFLSLLAAFVISNALVGAFGRIIRELDDILAGKSGKQITYRPNDTLSADLLKRVNVLIKFYVDNRKS